MRTDVIETTSAAWTAEPERGKSTPTVSARADGSQAIIEAGPFTWRADLPVALGGSNEAPSPTALLLGALAGCAVVFVRDVLAPQLGYTVDAVEASVRCAADARGLLGMDGATPDLQDIRVDVSVTSPDGAEAVAAIADLWEQRCPIYLALIKPMAVEVGFRVA